MELKDIYELFDRFENSTCRKMELDLNGAHFCLERGGYTEGAMTGAAAYPAVVQNAAMGTGNRSPAVTASKLLESNMASTATVTAAAEAGEAAASTAVPQTATSAAEETVSVRAPLVGTFYRAAGPDEEPFVKVGQQVHKGDVVGIIEAMKLMNEVTAPQDGIVDSIPAEDGKMVEYNQILITLK